MRVVLFSYGEREGKAVTDLEMDSPPCVGDEISVMGIGDYVVRRRRWDTVRISAAWEPNIIHTAMVLHLYVQTQEAFAKELRTLNASDA